MSSKYFIRIVHVPMCLWEFFWNFWEILEYFSVALLIYLDISRFIIAQENISKKI
jgi:hypothetical protein